MIAAAQNIYEHSDVERLMGKYNADEKEIFENIMFGLGETICTTFEATEVAEPNEKK
jgi:hypothetical protein